MNNFEKLFFFVLKFICIATAAVLFQLLFLNLPTVLADDPVTFGITYHLEEDTEFESPIESDYLKAGDYVIRIEASSALVSSPAISIDSQGTLNDVTAGATTSVSGTVYLFERTVVEDTEATGAVREVITVNGTEVDGEKFIDTTAPVLALSDNQLDSIVKDTDTVLITAWFAELGQIDEDVKPKITIGTYVVDAEMTKQDNKTWLYVWDVPSEVIGSATVSITATDEAGNQVSNGTDAESYLIDNLFFTALAAIPPPDPVCKDAERIVRYHVSAIDALIPANGWGDTNTAGVIYALNNIDATPNVSQIKDQSFKLYDLTDQSIPQKVQPLVLRANEGDCVEVILRNELDASYGGIEPITSQPTGPTDNKRNVGMQITGLSYDPKLSDGAFFGLNPDTTVATGQERVFRWYANRTGGFMFRDSSNIQWPQDTITKGLFGMLVVEPKGSTWRDSITGRNFLKSSSQNSVEYNDLVSVGEDSLGRKIFLGVGNSIFADVHQAPGAPLPKGSLLSENVSGNDYRDYALIMHDEFEGMVSPIAWNEDGSSAHYGAPYYPATGIEDGMFLINYRAEPLRNRAAAWERHRGYVPVPGVGLLDSKVNQVKETPEIRVTIEVPDVKIEILGVAGEVLKEITREASRSAVILPNGKKFEPGDEFCTGGEFDSDNARSGDPKYKFYKCVGEEAHLQSWPFGDPAVAMPRAYWGDPIVIYAANADSHDTHTFHQHTHRWLKNPEQADNSKQPIPENAIQESTRLDVQGIGAMEVFKLVYEHGAGSVTGTAGDSIFHCHLYPHFAGGIWSAVRVFDRLKVNFTDSGSIAANLPDGAPLLYPDGTEQAVLQPLAARVALFDTKNVGSEDHRAEPPEGMANRVPQRPDADHPGFPNFIAGKFGQKALQPPKFVINPTTGLPIKDRATPTQLETNASYDGIRPGATLVDPCKGANGEFGADRKPDRIYEPVAIQIPFIQNLKGGFFNPEQRAYVEKEFVDGVRDDPTLLEPYTFRANVGDCVEVHTTNNLQPDDDTPTLGVNDGVFHGVTNTPEISQHIHPVRFDQLGSDGTSVGWNYDISNRSGETAAYRWFVDVNVRTVFSHDHQFPTSHQQGGFWSAFVSEPASSKYKNSESGGSLGPTAAAETYDQTSKKYSIADLKGVGTKADIIVESPSGGENGGISGGGISSFREFAVHYSDFTPSFVADSTALKTALDAYKAGNRNALFASSLRTKPFNPPFEVEDYLADQGLVTINYKVEPLQARVNPDDAAATAAQKEPANVFSSIIHGDPETEVFRAYAKDPVVIRFMDGAHEEHHNFEMHGHRWLHQPSNQASTITDNQSANIGEFFNFELVGNTRLGEERLQFDSSLAAGLPGDYLFGSGAMAEIFTGLWGIFRVENGLADDLNPLPINPEPPVFEGLGLLDPVVSAAGPVPAVTEQLTNLNTPCPENSPKKHFDVVAIQKSLTYNEKYNETDPFGLMYVLKKDKDAVLSGTKSPEPLALRVNEGDCIEVELTNELPDLTALAHSTSAILPDGTTSASSLDANTLQHLGEAQPPAGVTGLPADPTFSFAKWPMSNRVSLHPRLLKSVVSVGDGATVGFMRDQTIGPGEKITYLWYADRELGTVLLDDYGDLRSHRHHGLFAALIVEPKDTIFLDPKDGNLSTNPLNAKQIESGISAVVFNQKDGSWFRDFATFFVTGINIRKDNKIIPDAEGVLSAGKVEHQPCSPTNAICEDAEGSGEGGLNYRAVRLGNRAAMDMTGAHAGHASEIAFNLDAFKVFSSSSFEEPSGQIFEAFKKDPSIFRVLLPGENSNVHALGLSGHSWHSEPDSDSNVVSTEGGIGPGKALNFNLLGGAGGEMGISGDYFIGTRNHVEPGSVQGGMWGIFRVSEPGALADIIPVVEGFDPSKVNVTSSSSTSTSTSTSETSASSESPVLTPTEGPQILAHGGHEHVFEDIGDDVLGISEPDKAETLVPGKGFDFEAQLGLAIVLSGIGAAFVFLKYGKAIQAFLRRSR